MTTTPDPIDWADLNVYEPPADPDDEPAKPARTPLEFPTTDAPGDPKCAAERARVLRHPDIAKRLCDPPQSYSRPENWSGYVPPDTWNGRTNDSPVRKQLLAIVAAAVEADKAAAPAVEEASA